MRCLCKIMELPIDRQHRLLGSALAFVLLTFLLLIGCAKEKCYQCEPAGNIPGEKTERVCGKGTDLDISLSFWRSKGYTCSKDGSGSAKIAGPKETVTADTTRRDFQTQASGIPESTD